MATDESDLRKQRLEEQKLSLDYIKHVSTLAASIIVFSIAFTSQISRGEWKWLLIAGFGGLLLCLVALTLAAVGVIAAGRTADLDDRSAVPLTVKFALAGLGGFLIGITAFSVFLVRNLV